MSNNFVVSVYDGTFRVAPPDNFLRTEVQTISETSTYRPPEIPDADRSGVEIAMTAAMVIMGTLALVGSIHLNHRHNQAVTRRMQSNDKDSLVRHHSLQ